MICYKLTDENCCTYGDEKNPNLTKWGEGVTHEIVTPNISQPLCTEYWLHAFIDPRLAVILNPIYSEFINPQLWEAEAEGYIKYDKQLQLCCTKLTTIRRMQLPKISDEKIVEFAIRCVLKTCHDEHFKNWAENWLNGNDRTETSARMTRIFYLGMEGLDCWMKKWITQAAEDYAAMYMTGATRKATIAIEYAVYIKNKDIDLLSILDECGIIDKEN